MRRLLTAAVVMSSLGLAGVAAAAESGERAAVDTERGEQLFKKGTAAFEAQRYSDAYAALRSAWDLAPSYRTAAGLGQVELHLGQYRDAAEHLSYCLRRFPSDGDARVRAHVEEGLEQAREHVAALRVRVNVEGATIAVDGKAAGKSPLEGVLFVEPGSHVVTASNGMDTTRAPIDARVRATEEVSLSLPLEVQKAPPAAPGAGPVAPAPAPAAAELPNEPPPVDSSHGGIPGSTVALIVGGSLTAVALGTSIGFHVKGSNADDDATAQRRQIDSSSDGCRSASDACSRLKDSLDERNSANTVSLVAAIGTGVFAAATVSTYLVLRGNERSHASGSRPLTVGFGPVPGGGGFLSVRGGF